MKRYRVIGRNETHITSETVYATDKRQARSKAKKYGIRIVLEIIEEKYKL